MALTPRPTAPDDSMLLAAVVAAVLSTALIFFVAYQTPLHPRASGKRSSRAAVNAAEEHAIWSRAPRPSSR